jgi:tetratricopeptide (TPR) repeat protein
VAIDSKYGNAHVNLSAAYLSLKRFDAAAAEARTALQIDGRNPDAMVNLSLAQHALGQTGDAQGSLRRALEIDPHNAAAHYNLALQCESAGEGSAAIDHYKKFIQYASPEQASYAADVRTRLAALAARLK